MLTRADGDTERRADLGRTEEAARVGVAGNQ